ISLVLLTQAILIYYHFNSSSKALINKTYIKLFKMSEDYSDELDERLDNYNKSLNILSYAFLDSRADQSFINTFQSNFPEFKIILHTRLDGSPIRFFPDLNTTVKSNPSKLSYWSNIKSSQPLAMSDATDMFGFPAIVLSSVIYPRAKPLADLNKATVLSVVIPLDELFHFSQNLLTEEKAHIMIFNKDGQIIHHPDDRLILKRSFSDLSEDKAFANIQSAMTKMSDKKLGWATYHLNNKKYFISFVKNRQKNWIISINGVLSHFSRDMDNLGWWTFFSLSLGFIGSIIIIYFLIQKLVTKNVHILKDAMQRVREGILGQKLSIDTNDEMANLASSFNYMSEHLKISQTKQKESEEQLRRLSECVPEGIIIHNNGILIDGNQTLADMLGYPLPELIGINVLDIAAPGSRDIIISKMSSSKDEIYEAMAVKKDGTELPIEISSRHYTYQGKHVRIATIRDISERKRMQSLRESVERIARHDLKNPLNSILGYTQLLMKQNLSENLLRYTNAIQENSHLMRYMIDHSLDIFDMEQGNYKIKAQEINLIKIFHKLDSAIKNQYATENIKINYYLGSKAMTWHDSCVIWGESDHIEKMFMNLLIYSIEQVKHKGNITVNIDLNENNHVHIDMHINTVIPESLLIQNLSQLPKLETLIDKQISLYNSMLIARSHGGSVQMETSKPIGTHIIVDIPDNSYLVSGPILLDKP
ncbi:MAG: PAS domain S-box protein, partial [Spirochaetota bacterium]|nr:PAS domain S-box protein [Spirochaetota bacterium]